ncbi:unnamed protein product [Closterium sp. Yama58-4]|nr:unnamed protein product [Closterium sp. Yama58-4]
MHCDALRWAAMGCDGLRWDAISCDGIRCAEMRWPRDDSSGRPLPPVLVRRTTFRHSQFPPSAHPLSSSALRAPPFPVPLSRQRRCSSCTCRPRQATLTRSAWPRCAGATAAAASASRSASLAAALASLRTVEGNGGCVGGGGASAGGGNGSGGSAAQSWPLIAMEYDEMPGSPGGAQGLAVGEFDGSTITAFDRASAPLPAVTAPQFSINLTDPMPGGAHIRVDQLTASFYRISYTVILVAPDNTPQSAALLLSAANGGGRNLNSG